jgi:hypothetical protein
MSPFPAVLDQEAVVGFKAWMLPAESMQTSALNTPGIGESPVPLCAVIVPFADSSEEPEPYFLTQVLVSVFEDLSVGALNVVVLLFTQVIVPPLASDEVATGWELPPVLPPVQPLKVMVPLTVPVMVVHVVFTVCAPATPPNASVAAAENGIVKAATMSSTRLICHPS